jgi:hypothetical protein
MSFLIPKELLDRSADVKPAVYSIAFDKGSGPDLASYCLARMVNGSIEILLAKSSRDKDNLAEEAENLARYFNAEKL